MSQGSSTEISNRPTSCAPQKILFTMYWNLSECRWFIAVWSTFLQVRVFFFLILFLGQGFTNPFIQRLGSLHSRQPIHQRPESIGTNRWICTTWILRGTRVGTFRPPSTRIIWLVEYRCISTRATAWFPECVFGRPENYILANNQDEKGRSHRSWSSTCFVSCVPITILHLRAKLAE